MKTIEWLNITMHGARLGSWRSPDNTPYITVLGVLNPSAQWTGLRKLGFLPTRDGVALMRKGKGYTLAEMKPLFPGAQIVATPIDQIFMRHSADNKEKVMDSANFLGVNANGDDVFDGSNGRYTKNTDGVVKTEINGALQNWECLRFDSPESLAKCADGLVLQMARGQALKKSDLVAFVTTVTEKPFDESDPVVRQIQESVEAAVQRYIGNNFQTPNDAAFWGAVQMDERQPAMVFRTSDSVINQQYSTPLPMSIAAQRLLGNMENKRVLEPTIGNGSLIMCLPPSAQITGVEIDPNRAERAKATFGLASIICGDFLNIEGDAAQTVFDPVYDAVISNPPFGGLPKPVQYAGLKVNRIDQLIALTALNRRADDGRAVIILGADRENIFPGKGGIISGGSKTFFNWLADHFEIEDAVELDGRLYSKQGSQYPVRMITVGKRRSPEDAKRAFVTEEYRLPERITTLHSWSELWEHTEQIVKNRPAEATEELSVDPIEAPADPSLVTQFQAPYVPLSEVSESEAMLPRNLEAPTNIALAALADKVGNVDDYVCNKIGYSKAQLAAAFGAEQVDAIALALNDIDENRGIVIGDKTGMGKGRILAAIAVAARREGTPVVFLTEKPNLFSDFWRDIDHIGASDLFNPVIVNAGVGIFNLETGKRIHKATPSVIINKMMDEQRSAGDEGIDLLMATYSQFNRDASKSKKSNWLPDACRGAVVICDESHNATGDSNTCINVGKAIEGSVAAVYSSATFAKNATNFAIYNKVFPSSVSITELKETLEQGGEPLLEILSSMMVQDGVMLRRTHDQSKIDVQIMIDEANMARNRALSDELSKILLAMSYLSGDVKDMVRELKKEIKQLLEDLPESARAGNRMQVSCSGFGSRLFNLRRQFMMALKADTTADLAISLLRSGEKPAITLEQTMESVIADALSIADEVTTPSIDDVEFDEPATDIDVTVDPSVNQIAVTTEKATGIPAEGMTIPQLTFRDVLYRVLNKIQVIVKQDAYGQASRVLAVDEIKNDDQRKSWTRSIERIREMIDEFPAMPISPIDYIHQRIADAGYTTTEISGRGLTVMPIGNGMMRVMPKKGDRVQAQVDFNSGKADAIVLTRAGSTGLSLHSSSSFKDQRRRVRVAPQFILDESADEQMDGRFNRRGQVSPPRTVFLCSGLPSELRLLAQKNKKSSLLSSNTQSNRNNAGLLPNVPDMQTSIYNRACQIVLTENPDIAGTLDIDLTKPQGRDSALYYANALTGRLDLLVCDEADRIMNEVTLVFESEMSDLEAKGINPMRPKMHDWGAVEVARTHLSGSIESASVFDQPVYVATLEYKEEIEPLRAETIRMEITQGRNFLIDGEWGAKIKPAISKWERDSMTVPAITEAIKAKFKTIKMLSLPSNFETVDDALASEDDNPVKSAALREQFLLFNVNKLLPGTIIRYMGNEGEAVEGVITTLLLPKQSHVSHLGQYEMDIAIPGHQRTQRISLHRIRSDEHFTVIPYKLTEDKLKEFDEAPSGIIKRTRHALVGNLFAAAEIAARGMGGQSSTYTDQHGTRHRAIILPHGFHPAHVDNMPVRLPASMVSEYLSLKKGEQVYIETAASGERIQFRFNPLNGKGMSMDIPGIKSKFGNVFANPLIVAHTGQFAGTRQNMRATFAPEKLAAIAKCLYDQGYTMFVPANDRTLMNQIAGGKQASLELQDSDNECEVKAA